jgi:hypothetical protein
MVFILSFCFSKLLLDMMIFKSKIIKLKKKNPEKEKESFLMPQLLKHARDRHFVEKYWL